MRLIIFTGFLGSGKTTALLSLAGHLSADNPPSSIVIIENEIGEANVDGRLLGESNFEVRDLTAGCICCTLSGQLIAALEDIRASLNPSWLLIEATGIAHQTIADVIGQSMPGLKPVSIVLADAERWDELMENLPMLIMTQLENADIIMLNKVDAVSPEEAARIEGEIDEINSRSPRFNISARVEGLSSPVWGKVVDHVCGG